MNLQSLITRYCFVCAAILSVAGILLAYGLGYNSGTREKIVVENKISCKTFAELIKSTPATVKTAMRESK